MPSYWWKSWCYSLQTSGVESLGALLSIDLQKAGQVTPWGLTSSVAIIFPSPLQKKLGIFKSQAEL